MAVANVQQLQQQNLELQQQNLELRRELTCLKESGVNLLPFVFHMWYMYLATQVLVTYTLSIGSHTPYVYAKELSCYARNSTSLSLCMLCDSVGTG